MTPTTTSVALVQLYPRFSCELLFATGPFARHDHRPSQIVFHVEILHCVLSVRCKVLGPVENETLSRQIVQASPKYSYPSGQGETP